MLRLTIYLPDVFPSNILGYSSKSWLRLISLIDFDLLEKSIVTVSLEELIETYPKILNGEISGRVIVDLNK